MEINYRKKRPRVKYMKMWIKIASAYNRGVAPAKMINNEKYISPLTSRPYKTVGQIYNILKIMKEME